jgi:hypothetical protein
MVPFSRSKRKFRFTVLIALVFLGAILGMSVLKLVETQRATLKSPGSNQVAAKPARAVTLSTYRLVRTGMSYPQVVDIVGRKADDTESPFLGDKAEVFAEWRNPDGSGFAVTFRNGRLLSQSQTGLDKDEHEITLFEYGAVGCLSNRELQSIGVPRKDWNTQQFCTYDELVDLFGRQGVEVSSVHLPNSGTTTEVYEWHNSDGATVVVTFQKGRMISKAMHGLR